MGVLLPSPRLQSARFDGDDFVALDHLRHVLPHHSSQVRRRLFRHLGSVVVHSQALSTDCGDCHPWDEYGQSHVPAVRFRKSSDAAAWLVLGEKSDLLEEEHRITLRSMKAAVLDFSLLIRAVVWSKQNHCEHPQVSFQLEV